MKNILLYNFLLFFGKIKKLNIIIELDYIYKTVLSSAPKILSNYLYEAILDNCVLFLMFSLSIKNEYIFHIFLFISGD